MRRLSEAELNVLGVLWEQKEGFVLGDIVEALKPATGWLSGRGQKGSMCRSGAAQVEGKNQRRRYRGLDRLLLEREQDFGRGEGAAEAASR